MPKIKGFVKGKMPKELYVRPRREQAGKARVYPVKLVLDKPQSTLYHKVKLIREVWLVKTEEALDQIAYLQKLIVQTRLRAADGYLFFLLWGLLWIAGYVGSLWWHYGVWVAIFPVGALLSAVIGFRIRKDPVPPLLKKIGWLMLILFVYIALLFNQLLRITDNIQVINVFWPFHIGLLYILAGIFAGRSLILIGGWLILAAGTGLWIPSPFQEIWLAVGGGGGLILTGIIMRKQVIKNA